MSPEDYTALLASGKVAFSRDIEGNYLYNASKTSTAVLPRDIIQQLEKGRKDAVDAHTARLAAFDRFITDLKNTN